MKSHSPIRVLLLAAASLLLGACEMTTFQAAPIAASGCDAALVGQWLSLDEDPAKNGDVVLHIDDACQLRMDNTEQGVVRRSEPTALHLGQHGLYRYAWVDARWALLQFDEDNVVAQGDVYLVRIARDDNRLTLWTVDDKAVAHAIIDNELKGDVVFTNRDLFNRLTETGKPAVLDHPGLFKADPVMFMRKPDAGQ